MELVLVSEPPMYNINKYQIFGSKQYHSQIVQMILFVFSWIINLLLFQKHDSLLLPGFWYLFQIFPSLFSVEFYPFRLRLYCSFPNSLQLSLSLSPLECSQ